MSRDRVASRLWLAALLLPPVLAAAVLPGEVSTLVCRSSGAVMSHDACCPGRQLPPETEARLRGEACCVLRTVDLGRPMSQGQSRIDGAVPGRPDLQAGAAAVAPAAPVLAAAARSAGTSSAGPPPLGPPLILRKRSFLI